MLSKEEEIRVISIIQMANAEIDKKVGWAESFTTETVLWLATKLKELDDIILEQVVEYEGQIASLHRLLDDKLR